MLRIASAGMAAALIFAGCSSPRSTAVQDDLDVVATVSGDPIHFAELQREFHRSAGLAESETVDSLEAYQDFLERYVNYRLKVLEAEAVGLDKDPQTLAEIDGYRRQYARPYLLDRTVLDPLVRELFARQQEAVDVSHILLQVPPDAPAADTLAKYERLSAIADSIRNGADFGDMAARHSEDPSAGATRPGPGYRGRLGFISGGVTVKPFEDAAYETPVGSLSHIVRTRFGYHLLKVHEKIQAPGDVRISHIMITPNAQTKADSAAALARLDTVVTRLAEGGDYAALASVYSSDRQSAENGGDLGFIGFTSRFVQELKDVAFALDEIGSVSDPVETQYGFHVLKLTGRRELPTLEDSYDDLKQRASRLPEATTREKAYADSMLAVRGATVDTMTVERLLAGIGIDSLQSFETYPRAWDSTSIATIADSSYTLSRFVSSTKWPLLFGEDARTPEAIKLKGLREFMRLRAIDYEMAALAKTDEDFARTIREFRNGILLFTLMEDSVWTAASQDTVALERLFEETRSDYMFPERSIVVGVYSRSVDLVNAAVALMKGGLGPEATIDSLNAAGALQIDTTYVSEATNSIYDRAISRPVGTFAETTAYNNGHIALMHAGTAPPRPKTFEEARAELVNLRQERLEEELVARLRDKYNAHTYPMRLPALLGTGSPMTTSGVPN